MTPAIETFDSANVYTSSPIAALVLIDIGSTPVAPRRGDGGMGRLDRMKRRLDTFRPGDEPPA